MFSQDDDDEEEYEDYGSMTRDSDEEFLPSLNTQSNHTGAAIR